MSSDGNRFGHPYLSGILGKPKDCTGKQVVADFKSGEFTPILVAGICNPAGPTLTVFSLRKPDAGGEVWLCEHMLNPFQTSFHRMARVSPEAIGFSPGSGAKTGADALLAAFVRIHLAEDQSFTPGTYHTYLPAVSHQATESAVREWMEKSESTPCDLEDLTDASLSKDLLKRASYSRIQERIASRRITTKPDAEKLLSATLDPSQQAIERQGIIAGWDTAQARAPRLTVVTTTAEIKAVFDLVAKPMTSERPTKPINPSPWDDPTKGGRINPKIDELSRDLDEAARHREMRERQRQKAREAREASKEPIKQPMHVPKEVPPESWARQWGKLSQELSQRTRYERSGHWLEVWAQLKDGSSLQGGHYVEKWAEKAAELCTKGCSLGLVGMRQTSASHKGSPGVSFALTSPSGGAPVARQLMSIFARHGLGGALADAEANGRWAIVKYLYAPHWYAASGDRTFGADWSAYDQPTADHNEGKQRWCAGVEAAVRAALRELPPEAVDSILFDTYALKDTLDLLTRAQWLTLRNTPHPNLGALLLQPTIPPAGFWARLWG
jgi:hypothetical protein